MYKDIKPYIHEYTLRDHLNQWAVTQKAFEDYLPTKVSLEWKENIPEQTKINLRREYLASIIYLKALEFLRRQVPEHEVFSLAKKSPFCADVATIFFLRKRDFSFFTKEIIKQYSDDEKIKKYFLDYFRRLKKYYPFSKEVHERLKLVI